MGEDGGTSRDLGLQRAGRKRGEESANETTLMFVLLLQTRLAHKRASAARETSWTKL